MKINTKMSTFILILFVIGILYFFSKEDKPVQAQAQQRQAQAEQRRVIVEKPPTLECNILDRLPLNEEVAELIPANEVNINFHKDWQEGCGSNGNELYATDVPPLFDLQGPINLVAPNLNSSQRRVNFY
jgi:hypothetical protein